MKHEDNLENWGEVLWILGLLLGIIIIPALMVIFKTNLVISYYPLFFSFIFYGVHGLADLYCDPYENPKKARLIKILIMWPALFMQVVFIVLLVFVVIMLLMK